MEPPRQSSFDPMKVVWYLWLAMQVLVFCVMICAFVATGSSDSKPYGFVAVWVTLLTIGFSVGGTLVLRRPNLRSALAVGFMIGCSFMLAMQHLELAVLSAASGATSSMTATSVFAVFCFVGYTAFTGLLVLYRGVLLPGGPMAGQDDSLEPPHMKFGGNDFDGIGGHGGMAPVASDAGSFGGQDGGIGVNMDNGPTVA